MRRKMLGAFAGVGLLVAGLSLPVQAHHSLSAEFDQSKPISFNGTVKRIDWGNPHIYTHVETKEGDKTVVYKVEGGAPNALYRQGWREDTLKPGDAVSVRGIRAKNPESPNIGNATITKDGVSIFQGQKR
ncbi:MAG TPA: DUF6152 family protein [Terriglobia bacterium]|nr:DUF6152 family protein [Terriglobia bacterium]